MSAPAPDAAGGAAEGGATSAQAGQPAVEPEQRMKAWMSARQRTAMIAVERLTQAGMGKIVETKHVVIWTLPTMTLYVVYVVSNCLMMYYIGDGLFFTNSCLFMIHMLFGLSVKHTIRIRRYVLVFEQGADDAASNLMRTFLLTAHYVRAPAQTRGASAASPNARPPPRRGCFVRRARLPPLRARLPHLSAPASAHAARARHRLLRLPAIPAAAQLADGGRAQLDVYVRDDTLLLRGDDVVGRLRRPLPGSG